VCDAASEVVGSVTRDVVWDAAWDEAWRGAWNVVRGVAWDAAGDAAYNAAWSAIEIIGGIKDGYFSRMMEVYRAGHYPASFDGETLDVY